MNAVLGATLAAALAAGLGAVAVLGEVPGERTLRVCADPNNLPFSNERREGFDNAIAELIAGELDATLEYTWWAQRRGFLRSTLGAGACDLVFGVPPRSERALATRPYYRSTYVFVTRADTTAPIVSLDDPRLRELRVGVHLIGDDYTNTPPAHALARRGIIHNVAGYVIYGDYREPNPPARLVEAVARGDVDVAIVWGPLAGYFAPRQRPRLRMTPVQPESDGPELPFVFDVSMAVRRGDRALHDEVEQVLERRRDAIDSILHRWNVPLVPRPARVAGAR